MTAIPAPRTQTSKNNIRANRYRVQKILKSTLLHAVTVLVCFVILVPFLWLLTSSLRTPAELYTPVPHWIPAHPTLANYRKAFGIFINPLLNSILYGVVCGLFSLIVASPAAYSMARLRYRGKKIITAILLITQMLPFVLILLPLYISFIRIRIYDTRWGLMIALAALTVPYSILLLRSYFETLPAELEEQAMMDGCTRLETLWRVVLPLSSPGLMSVFLSNVILVWNDILFTVFLTKSAGIQTASVVLYNLFSFSKGSGGSIDQGALLAMGVLLTLPILALFIFLQKYLVKGLTLGALKA